MDFAMFRWPWKKKSPPNEGLVRIAYLDQQIAGAKEFMRVIDVALKLNSPVTVWVKACGASMGARVGNTDLPVRNLYDFAAGYKLHCQGEREELLKRISASQNAALWANVLKSADSPAAD